MFCVELGWVKVVYIINYYCDWEKCIIYYVHLFLWVDVCGYVFNIRSQSYTVKGRTYYVGCCRRALSSLLAFEIV